MAFGNNENNKQCPFVELLLSEMLLMLDLASLWSSSDTVYIFVRLLLRKVKTVSEAYFFKLS